MAKQPQSDINQSRDLLENVPCPELAAALRSRSSHIINKWVETVQKSVPSAHSLSFEELQDNLPKILSGLANALESKTEGTNLRVESPWQGLTRFQQRYEVRDLMTEDRLLRRVVIEQSEAGLGRPMNLQEQLALALGIDAMLQEAVVAFITQQNAQLRNAAEAELKYLSFLSHDLNNNLGGVTLLLQTLRTRLAGSPEFAQDVRTLDTAQQSILYTIGGMGRLLQAERLRKAGIQPEIRPINLHHLASQAAGLQSKSASNNGVKVVIDIPADLVVKTDGELTGLVIQNLIGNAVKYSTKGTVRIVAACENGDCVVTVSDEGPGIAVEHVDRIFEAFRRGEAYGQPGVGLGLTIAAQATKLIGGRLAVSSIVGVGSTFSLTFPYH